MQIRGEISIQKALDEIRNEYRERPFVLQFVRSSGKSAGSLKVVRAIYGRSKQPIEAVLSEKRDISQPLHKEVGTLPMMDADTGEYITPLISHFRILNGYKIKH